MENIKLDQHIVLVGYMGVGKTTIGKILAERLNVMFYDTDEVIVKKMGRSIVDIFENTGEAYFRKLENEVIKELLSEDVSIISTGGGLPCFGDNMDVINRESVSIKLQVGVNRLVNRLINSKDRPLLKEMDEKSMKKYIAQKLKERNTYYNKATVTIRAIGGPQYIVDRILRKIL